MKALRINCGKCRYLLSFPLPGASVHAQCPICGTDILVEAFPALLRESGGGQSAEALTVDDESSCFYHPTKKAVIPCEECGRFLCSLCDIDFNGRRLCPTCIERGAEKGKLERLQKGNIRYDEIALFLAIVPIIFFCVTIFTAPAALFIAIRYWNAPMSVVPRSRWRLVAAIILASCQILGWGLYGLSLFGDVIFG